MRQNQQQPRILGFTGLLTSYTTKRGRISSSLTSQDLQVYLPPIPLNAVELVVASHLRICRSTYTLYYKTQQNQQQPRILGFIGLFTSYTTKRGRISSSLASQDPQVYLYTILLNAVELAVASYFRICRSIYTKEFQGKFIVKGMALAAKLHLYQSLFKGRYLQVYLYPIPLNAVELTVALYLRICRSTYTLYN